MPMKCEMYIVRLTDGIDALLCGNCGAMTLNMNANFCPGCGSEVESIQDDGDEYEGIDMAMRYAHDQGFDEGYESAMQEEI